MNNINLAGHINNKLQEYKNELKSINSSILPFGDIDEDKKLFRLKKELYNKYVKDVKGNYYGFFYPVSYKDFFKLIQEEQKG